MSRIRLPVRAIVGWFSNIGYNTVDHCVLRVVEY